MDTGSKVIKDACTDILKNICKNRCHYLKKEFFDQVEASKVSIKSPVTYLTDEQWQALVKVWSSAKHKVVCILPYLAHSTCLVFFIVCK
jgi:hypothetical protein